MLVPIAIPSYRRAKTLRLRTLRFLKEALYPTHLITVFVASEEERVEYVREIPEKLYGDIVVGVKGLMEQRRFISEFYSEGELICQMDDDVSMVKTELGFLELIEFAVKSLESEKCGLWGVLPNDDGRRFQDKTTTHLTHILGSFFVCRNAREIVTTTADKEDYERSILYFLKDGKVLRYKNAGVRTTYNQGTGGLQGEGRVLRMKADVEKLTAEYPQLCKAIVKRGLPDIRLNWRATSVASSHALCRAEDESVPEP
jgi:hypothetical protein